MKELAVIFQRWDSKSENFDRSFLMPIQSSLHQLSCWSGFSPDFYVISNAKLPYHASKIQSRLIAGFELFPYWRISHYLHRLVYWLYITCDAYLESFRVTFACRRRTKDSHKIGMRKIWLQWQRWFDFNDQYSSVSRSNIDPIIAFNHICDYISRVVNLYAATSTWR